MPKPKLTTRMVSSECPNCGSHKTKNNEGNRFFENQLDYRCDECGCQWYIRKVITNQGQKMISRNTLETYLADVEHNPERCDVCEKLLNEHSIDQLRECYANSFRRD